ncbi:hypothetical protein [Gynuella sp.]|uniref:hypothetical protein n=1 Tax=Gynuella sp. TaxID=2969146 RepID=UPI003D13A55B
MKKLILISALLISSNLYSEELCPDLDVKVELDHWMTEEAFDDESALWALKQLTAIVTDDIDLESDFLKDIARLNVLQILEGYFLRVEAHREREGSILDAGSTVRYCKFLEPAVWVD